jgi:hypothetical protein
MASVKAADLIKSWTKTTATLESDIKSSLGKDIEPKDLKDLQSTYKDWKDLLSDAQKKAGKWDEKDDKDFEKFKSYLKSQLSNAREYDSDLKKIEQQLAAEADTEKRLAAALLQANNYYRHEVQEELRTAEEAMTQTQFALVRELPKAVNHQFQIAAKILSKDFLESLTPAGVTRDLRQIATKHKVALRDLEADKRLEAFIIGQAKKSRTLEDVLDGLRDRAQALEQEVKEKTAESTDKNASPEYKATLNKMLKTYKDAYGELKKGFSATEDSAEELEKAKTWITKADADMLADAATKAISAAEAIFTAVGKLDKQIDASFGDAPYLKKLEKNSLTSADITKFFKPLQAKADDLGKRAGGVRSDAKTEITAIVKLLQKKASEQPKASDAGNKDLEALTKSIRMLTRLAAG